MADYDRDGFLDVYLCTYSYFIGAGEDKGGSPNPYHDARNGPPNVLFHNDGHGRFVDVTAEAGLEENDRFSFAAAWGDYDEDGWPDLLVANDFGRKNLYHNEGAKGGKVSFKDVTAAAGVEDSRRGHERRVSGLRRRRAPRPLHRQHVVRGRPARHRGSWLHAGRPGRDSRALQEARPRELSLQEPRRRHLRRRDPAPRAPPSGAGPGPRTASTSTTTETRTSTSRTACSPAPDATGRSRSTSTASSGGRSSRGRP